MNQGNFGEPAMSDDVWKTLIEAVTAVVTLAMLFVFAYMIQKLESNHD
jgi:hypothetical protein